MSDLYQAGLAALNDIVRRILDFVPNILSAFLMLLLGWIVAKAVEKAIKRILKTLRTDQAAERFGITGMLRNVGIEQQPSTVVARTFFWVLFALFVVSTFEALRLVYMSQLISNFLTYLPHLFGAGLIFVLGLTVARLIGNSVGRSARSAGLEYAAAVGLFVRYFLALIVVIVALAQLGVRTDILTNILTVLIVSLGLALALALGMGSRAVVANILAGAFAREQFREGREIEVQGIRGRIVSVGPVGTSIESEGRHVTVPNTILIENVIE